MIQTYSHCINKGISAVNWENRQGTIFTTDSGSGCSLHSMEGFHHQNRWIPLWKKTEATNRSAEIGQAGDRVSPRSPALSRSFSFSPSPLNLDDDELSSAVL